MAKTTAPTNDRARSEGQARSRLFQAVALFVVVTYAVSAVLYVVQRLTHLETYVFYLPSIGPLVGGLVALAVRDRLDLPIKWVPGLGFNIQVIRRSVLLIGVAIAIVMLCVQMYSFLRWNMKPARLDLIHYPGLVDEYVPPVFALICLGILVGVAMEEFGWRTVLEPTLRQAMPVWKTALVTGLIWSGWQWTVFGPVLNRWRHDGGIVVIAAYLFFWLVTQIAISMILVLAHNKMRRGNWVAAVAFRFVYGVGFFLILDEEVGRWQAMWAISMACLICAAVGYYYYWRSLNRKASAREPGLVAEARSEAEAEAEATDRPTDAPTETARPDVSAGAAGQTGR